MQNIGVMLWFYTRKMNYHQIIQIFFIDVHFKFSFTEICCMEISHEIIPIRQMFLFPLQHCI
ncbi:Uncharacterised protein [Bacteroides uniformis]|uniref:Uncharacterized protein n=1 Tax=Bacteroides uniformis TaxID=820 RepID=A0A174GMN0_BACUN|nr:Uncharacterised protein [Bacteroides uniformis]